jgi:hypothetical protein
MTKRPLAIAFEPETIDRLDKLAALLSARAGGVRVTRSDAVRTAVEHGIVALEAQLADAEPSKKPRKR